MCLYIGTLLVSVTNQPQTTHSPFTDGCTQKWQALTEVHQIRSDWLHVHQSAWKQSHVYELPGWYSEHFWERARPDLAKVLQVSGIRSLKDIQSFVLDIQKFWLQSLCLAFLPIQMITDWHCNYLNECLHVSLLMLWQVQINLWLVKT